MNGKTIDWGNGWRIPSVDQWSELIRNTTHKWITQNNVVGMLFKGKNGQSIFLPAAGLSYEKVGFDGEQCHYWSRNLNTYEPTSAYHFWSNGDCHINYFGDFRPCGFSIRPVLVK